MPMLPDLPASVRMTAELARMLEETCRSRLPYETCGVIYGDRSGPLLAADGFAVVRNIAAAPRRAFVFDPEDWVRTVFEAQKNRRIIVGLFHSHPGGTTAPSDGDAAGSLPWGTCWIVGLKEDGCRIAVYGRDSAGGWNILPFNAG